MSPADGNGLPEEWDQVRVGDVLKLQNGRAFKSSEWTTIGRPIIRIQNLKSPEAPFNYFDGDLPDKFAAQSGDLLFAWSGTPGTSFGAHIWHGPDAWVNQHIFRVEFSGDQFDRDFLKLALDVNTRTYIEQAQGGVGLAHITKAKLNESLLPVPPLSQQRLIALCVQVVEKKLHSTRTHLAEARRAIERFRQSVIAAACSGRLTSDWRDAHQDVAEAAELVDSARLRRQSEGGRRFKEPTPNEHALDVELPDSWAKAPLGLLLSGIKYGTSRRSEYGVKGVRVLRIPNVSSGYLDLTDMKFAHLPDTEARELALVEGDILMIRSNGSPKLVGRSTFVSGDAAGAAYAGYLMRLRTDPLVIEPMYLRFVLASPDLRHQIEMPLRSTSGVNNINTTEVRSLHVAVPPLDEQLEIVQRVEQLISVADGLMARIDAAYMRVDGSLRAVLAKAFRGELNCSGATSLA